MYLQHVEHVERPHPKIELTDLGMSQSLRAIGLAMYTATPPEIHELLADLACYEQHLLDGGTIRTRTFEEPRPFDRARPVTGHVRAHD